MRVKIPIGDVVRFDFLEDVEPEKTTYIEFKNHMRWVIKYKNFSLWSWMYRDGNAEYEFKQRSEA